MREDELLDNLKKMPSWIKENEDGTFTLSLKKENLIPDGKVVMEEQNGQVLESCQKLSTSTGKEMEVLLARRSIISPKLTDEDFDKLKGSNFIKLKYAVMKIYGLADFL